MSQNWKAMKAKKITIDAKRDGKLAFSSLITHSPLSRPHLTCGQTSAMGSTVV